MKLKTITDFLETIAPIAYQEEYDNAGLIYGENEMEIQGALITLDCVEEVIDEAIATKCNLIIAHHPIVFKGLKKLTGKNYIERVIIKAIKNNIAIYASHTNLDNMFDGVNKTIANKIGLIRLKILQPQKNVYKKLATYCPVANADQVRDALFSAGAGNISNYSECSFNMEGIGTFKPNEDANPVLGERGVRHSDNEIKIEVIYPPHKEQNILNALFDAHPYEEVAYDLIQLTNYSSSIGAGLIGELPEEMDEISFLNRLKKVMQTDCIRHTELLNKKIKRVAVCGGSGSFLLDDAIKNNADIFVSADFKYHQFFDADKKIVIADVGHYESEQFTKELFYELLTKNFPTFASRLSKINTNPIKYI